MELTDKGRKVVSEVEAERGSQSGGVGFVSEPRIYKLEQDISDIHQGLKICLNQSRK
jgi:hypothetical protein